MKTLTKKETIYKVSLVNKEGKKGTVLFSIKKDFIENDTIENARKYLLKNARGIKQIINIKKDSEQNLPEKSIPENAYNKNGKLTAQAFASIINFAKIKVHPSTAGMPGCGSPLLSAIIDGENYSYEQCVELFEANKDNKKRFSGSHTESDTIAF